MLNHMEPEPLLPSPPEPPAPERNLAWERVQCARHPKRPHTLDYVEGR